MNEIIMIYLEEAFIKKLCCSCALMPLSEDTQKNKKHLLIFPNTFQIYLLFYECDAHSREPTTTRTKKLLTN